MHRCSKLWKVSDPVHQHLNMVFTKRQDDEHFLNMHLDDRLPDDRRTKESGEWDKEVATSDTGQIKEGVWDLDIRNEL